MTELRWLHYVGPTLDQRMPATLVLDKSCWNQYVGPTLGQCTPATCFNMTELRWVHYVGPTLDQRMPATLVWIKVVENTALTQRWANVHQRLVLTWPSCVGCITLGQHWTNVCLPLWFWIKVVGINTFGQCTPATCFNMTELRWLHYVGPTLDQFMPATLVLDKSLLKILRWPQRWANVHWWLVFKKNMIWLCFMLNA